MLFHQILFLFYSFSFKTQIIWCTNEIIKMHKFYSFVECNIKIFQTCIFIMIIHWLIYVVKNDLDTKVPCNLFYSHSNSALRVFHKLRHLHKNHICRCNLCCKNHQHILQKSVLKSIYQTSNEFLNNHFFYHKYSSTVNANFIAES